MNETKRRGFHFLVKLRNRKRFVERSEKFRAKLKSKPRGTNESLPEIAQSIEELTRQSYPIAGTTPLSILSRDQFIDALPDPEMRLRLRGSKAQRHKRDHPYNPDKYCT